MSGYVILTENRAIPDEWALENDSPIFQSTFSENAKQLKAEVEKLRACDYPQKLIVVGLVSNIENLFESLRRDPSLYTKVFHSWYKYRPDGYETMFFSDLALWLSIVLPRYDIKKPETAALLQQWIDYCKAVQDDVLIYRGDEDFANNPKEKLDDIIVDLTTLHANICKANKASSFNDKIQIINSSILDMAKNVFDLFHLLLKGVNHREIQVAPFLRQAAKIGTHIPDPGMQKLLNYQMGQWIVETFHLAGITSNSFENTLNIDIETIALHINRDFSAMKDLKSTGLWGFARKNKTGKADRDVAIGYLNQIIDLHQLVLMLYFVRESVVLGALVSKEIGDAWVYGEDTAKGVVTALLNVIDHASKKLDTGVTDFWTKFYSEYRSSAGAKKDDTDPCFKALAEAKKPVGQVTSCYQSIQKIINEIRTDAESYKEEQEFIKDKERTLKQNLAKYGQITGLNIGSDFNSEGDDCSTSMPKVISVIHYISPTEELEELDAVEEIVIGYKKESLPFYRRIDKLLEDMNTPIDDASIISLCHCRLLVEPKKFHSDVQEHIYNDFLVPNTKVVTYPIFLSIFRNISPFKMANFIGLYGRVNAAMNVLYPVCATLTPVEGPKPVEIKLATILSGNSQIKRSHPDYFK